MYEKKPWLRFYGTVPHTLTYPDKSMYELVREAALQYPDYIAYDFMGTRSTYKQLLVDIDHTAQVLAARGLKSSDIVTICLPNCPQALLLFYAVNKIGAVAGMIHPLSTSTEIAFYLKVSRSTWAVTLDVFYDNIARVSDAAGLNTILLTRIGDFLQPAKRLFFYLAEGRKIRKPPVSDGRILWWKSLMRIPVPAETGFPTQDNGACAVILYSGGTTGTPRGIVLSSRNFNCLALQIATQGPMMAGDTMLSILPVFHGFGLGVCIHTFLAGGGKCILVPRFTPEIVAELIKKEKPQYMAGVPTLYEALLRKAAMKRMNLSCLKMAYAGGDKLPASIKQRFDALIREQGGRGELLEGYGLTESVTACIVTPRHEFRPGSAGIPLPDMLAKVVIPGTAEEAAPGTDGELCIAGPTVMLGYLDSPEASAQTLKKHADSLVWLHTGDICSMDKDGFVYFKLRMKRIIKVSGVSVSPVQIEEVLDSHPDVTLSCAIGIPDPYKIQVIKAFVILKDPARASAAKEQELIAYCRQHLITWAVPAAVEFRAGLPLTRVGKVAYSELEKEHLHRE